MGNSDGDLVWEAFIALIAHHQLTGSLEPFAHGAVCEVEAQCRIGLIALSGSLSCPESCKTFCCFPAWQRLSWES